MKPFCLCSLFTYIFFLSSPAQQPDYDSLLKVINMPQHDTGKVIAYRMLAGLTINKNPLKAVAFGKQGTLLGQQLGFDKGVAGCLLNCSAAYSAAGKLDSALLYVDTAIAWSLKVGEPGRLALAYLNRADYNRQLGNMKKALKDCDTSMMYADKANKDDTRARIYQTIGSVYHAQENYVQSKFYYQKAYNLYEKSNNKRMMAIAINNLGNCYKQLKEYENALSSFENAIRFSTEIKDEVSMPLYYTNLSDVYSEIRNYKKAEASALQAVKQAKELQNEVQLLNASMALANVYIKKGNEAAAIPPATEAYILAKKNALTAEAETAAGQLATAYTASNNYREAYKYIEISRSLRDSVSKQKFDGEVAAMQTSFNVDEKNKEILLLNKDRELQNQQIKQQRFLIIGSVAIALLSLIGIWLFVNRNRLRQQMKELQLRNQIAADLHDEVGSSLSSIHMLSQMATQQGNEAVHKDILTRMSNNAKETMEKMGDIVWMIKSGETEAGSLKQRMERFAYDICSSKNVELNMQLVDLEKVKLTMVQRKNTYLIFKEAINNSLKYSGTEKIEMNSFINNDKKLVLQLIDFGKGFDSRVVKKGNGLDNLQNRAKEMGALLSIESSPGKGTSVKLIMPV
jgi:two-component system, NarL family, sensor histidine kinase UhpB